MRCTLRVQAAAKANRTGVGVGGVKCEGTSRGDEGTKVRIERGRDGKGEGGSLKRYVAGGPSSRKCLS
jgi:hypothetical protein